MGWNVRLFLLLIPYAFCSESSYLSYGVKELGYLFFLSGSRVTNPYTYRINGFKPLFSSYYFRMITVDPETLILCFWVAMPPFLWHVSNLFEHLQPLCCPSHLRFLNNLMQLQNPSLGFDVLPGQVNHPKQWVDVLYCHNVYVGAMIMTLDV